MMRVFSSTIPWATRATASCAVRFGRYPYDPGWKSASKIGSRMSFNAPWTTRSRMAGIDRTRTFLPPSLGISFFRARMGRYVLVTNFSRICLRKLSAPLSSMASNVTPSIPGAPPLLLAIRYASRKVSILQTWTYSPQKRQGGSAFALTYRLLLRSCKLMGAFVISPLPSFLLESLQTAGPLRSADVTPLLRYYRPSRIPIAIHRLPGVTGYTVSLLRRFLDGTRRVSPVAQHDLVTVLSLPTPPKCCAASVRATLHAAFAS